MMKCLTFILIFCSCFFKYSYSQKAQIVSAQCGKCYKPVSTSSKVGDYCPHCKVRWGYENTSTTSGIVHSNPNIANRIREQEHGNSVNGSESKATKSETQVWLLSKLNAYSKEWQVCYKAENVFGSGERSCNDYIASYRFVEVGLEITRKYTFRYKELKTEHEEILTVPIYDIKELYDRGDKLSFNMNSNSIIKQKSDGLKEVSNFETVGFRGNAEIDLSARMEKAFNHLKKFYAKPKSSEPF